MHLKFNKINLRAGCNIILASMRQALMSVVDDHMGALSRLQDQI